MGEFVAEICRGSEDSDSRPLGLRTLVMPVLENVPLGRTVYVAASGHSATGRTIEDTQGNIWNRISTPEQAVILWGSKITSALTTADEITVEFGLAESISAIGLEFSGASLGSDAAGSLLTSETSYEFEYGVTTTADSRMVLATHHIRGIPGVATVDEDDGFTTRDPQQSIGNGSATSSLLFFSYKKVYGLTTETLSGTNDVGTWMGVMAGVWDADYVDDFIYSHTKPLAIPGTPVHRIIGGPRSLSPRIGSFTARKAASGGWMSCTGQVSAELVRDNPGILRSLADWYVKAKETGQTFFHGLLKHPPSHGGVVDLVAVGPGGKLLRAIRRRFYASFGTQGWVVQEAEPYRRGLSPKTAPEAALGAAGNVEAGIHRYKVTFVTAAGETRPGPRVEIEVTGGAKIVALSKIPIGPGDVTARSLYRTTAGDETYGLVDTINDNTTKTFNDNIADNDLGAEPPEGFSAPEIELSVKPGALNVHVARGATVYDNQSKRFLFPLTDDEKVSAIEISFEKNRDTASYLLRVLSGDDEGSALTLEEAISLDDDGPLEKRVELAKAAGLVAIEFKRNGEGTTNAQPFDLDIDVKVFGRARTANFTASDLVRDVFSELGISTRLVRECGIDILPQDFRGGNFMDPLELAQVVTGWRARVTRPYLTDEGDFRPYDTVVWTATHPFPGAPALMSEDPFSRAVVAFTNVDGRVIDYASAVADPNPLGRVVTSSDVFELKRPASKDVAKAIAQRIADEGVVPRFSGQDTFATLKLGGRIYRASHFEPGDCIYYPDAGVILKTQEGELLSGGLMMVTYPHGEPLIEKVNAQRDIGRAS